MYDAVIVCGGGLTVGGGLPEWVKRRLDKALECETKFYITVAGYTSHKPPVLKDGFPLYESVVCADYLVNKGIDRKKIRAEMLSFDTIGNAFFARALFTDIMKLKKVAIVTSEFHMPRTKAIFDWVFSLNASYDLDFFEASDEGLDERMLALRVKREKKSLENVETLRNRLTSWKEFHEWFFTEHEAYAVGLAPQRVSGELLNFY